MQGALPVDGREQHQDRLFDLIGDGVVGTDADFRITQWNRGAERLYGYTAAQVVGLPATEVATFAGVDRPEQVQQDLLERGRSRLEFTAVRRNGTQVEVEVVLTTARDETGEVRGYLGVHRDVTERRRAARHLEQALDDERRRIARALHDEALQDVRYALARAEAPREGSEPDELLVEALSRIGRGLRNAVYDLPLADEQRSLGDLLTELVELHRRMAPELRIDLHLAELPAPPARRTGGELVRIVGEALTNVRRHAGAGRVEVHAGASAGELWCHVADDGRGVEGGSTSGHGLAGMRERAASLGGRLDIRTPDAGGTVVSVGLPLSPAQEADAPIRVLLVEDHAAVREAIATAFRREPDLDVVGEAGTLAEARGMLDEVDVALVDLGLPDGDGSDLIAELREARSKAHAVVLSGGLDRAVIARAVERGAAGAFAKTDRLPDVIEAVRRIHAGETLLPLDEVVDLLRFASRERERELVDRQAVESLTNRELEILQLIADGCDGRQAAARLHISVRTQRNHVANILAKLNVHSQLQALIFALRHQLVELPGSAHR